MNSKAIVIREYGGPEVLVAEDLVVGEPLGHELLIRQTGIGVNYHDVYVRSGLYKTLTSRNHPETQSQEQGPDHYSFFINGDDMPASGCPGFLAHSLKTRALQVRHISGSTDFTASSMA
jgi:hypothetical protein